MNLPDFPRKKRSRELVPFSSEWFDQPWSNAVDFFERPFQAVMRPLREIWRGVSPKVDVTENEREVQVRAEVPGMRDKDLNISYSQGILTIEGEKKEEEEQKKGNMTVRESRYGTFRRDIPLGENLRWENAKASCKNGVLTVILPKKEEAVKKEARKIKID